MNEQDILNLIKKDQWMMNILQTAYSLNLPDWMIGAGFVRNKVWDFLHNYKKKEVDTADIDLIYYDPANLSSDIEVQYNNTLKEKLDINWSVKNQARMHKLHNRLVPYTNSYEALSEWVETPTCIAVKLEDDGSLILFAPHGIDDLVNLTVRPTQTHLNNLELFWERIKSKNWETKWPKLKFKEK